MKKIFILFWFSFFISNNVHSLEAVVIVFEAPLLKEEKMNAVVYQTLKKGSTLFISNEFKNLKNLPEYIPTLDRLGNQAFIPSKYIKIITHDLNEAEMPITYQGNDPTDYRIEEPIPETYPFSNTSNIRTNIALSLGGNQNSSLNYNFSLSAQELSRDAGGRFTLTRKIKFDRSDRYYFGFYTGLFRSNKDLFFKNNNSSKENQTTLRLGPLLTYDTFKNKNYLLTVGAGFTYNYHRSNLTMTSATGLEEERMFSGFSLSPLANIMGQIIDILPNTDFIGGVDLSLYLPHTQKSKDPIANPELWGSSSDAKIHSRLDLNLALFLGFQSKY